MELVGPSPEQWEALSLAEGLSATASHIQRIASKTSSEAASWAFTQWELRRRAKAKFALADQMLFTRPGLEMATHEEVARYHASLFPSGSIVSDLTCGIGADLIAFAAKGPAQGSDLDPVHAAYAHHNLSVHKLGGKVSVHDALEYSGSECVFLDPGRRMSQFPSSGGVADRPGWSKQTSHSLARIRNLHDYLPDPTLLIQAFRKSESLVIKLSPMLADEVLSEFAEAVGGGIEFVSHQGECKEALVRSGIAGFGCVKVGPEPITARRNEHLLTQPLPDTFIYEADPAAIRAHALAEFGATGLGDSNGYLTSDRLINSPWLTGFLVLQQGVWHAKHVKAELRAKNLSVRIVKLRGVPLDPPTILKLLKCEGEPVTLILYPVGSSIHFAIVKNV